MYYKCEWTTGPFFLEYFLQSGNKDKIIIAHSEPFGTFFFKIGGDLPVLGDKLLIFEWLICTISASGKNYNWTSIFLRILTPKWKQRPDYHCTYSMELFGTFSF